MPLKSEMDQDVKRDPEDVITILICDDHPAFARGLSSLIEIEAKDFSVVGIARSGEEAERMVRDLLPDVVLMDIRMPGMSGVEATRLVRDASPTTKVVALTVSEEASDLYGAVHAGATGYVMKDRDTPQILGVVRSVHAGHFVIPSELATLIVRDLDITDDTALNDRERQILEAIGRGETNRQIARRLSVSERTVKRRVEDIYSKLHFTDRVQAALYAAKLQVRIEQRRGPQQTRGP